MHCNMRKAAGIFLPLPLPCPPPSAQPPPVLSYSMTTASTCSPSCSCTSSLVVSPLALRCTSSTRVVCSANPASSAADAAFGKSGMSCQVEPG